MFLHLTVRVSLAYLSLFCAFARHVVSLPIYVADTNHPSIFIIPESFDLPPPAFSIYELKASPHLHSPHHPLLLTSPFPPPFRPLHHHRPRSITSGPSIVFITLGSLCALVMLFSAARCAVDYCRGPRHTPALTVAARERLLREMAANASSAQHPIAPCDRPAPPPPYDERAPPSYSSADDDRREVERPSHAVP